MFFQRIIGLFIVFFLLFTYSTAMITSSVEPGYDNGQVEGTRELFRPAGKNAVKPPACWDADGDHITDILEQRMAAGEPEKAIVVWSRPVTESDQASLVSLGLDIASYLPGLDMIEVNGITQSSAAASAALPGVDMVWHTGDIRWYGDVQTRNIKARESDDFSPDTAWELGYDGTGVSIAVMDTGVDNAHPSLSGKWLGGADISKPETFLTPRDGSFDADDPQGHGTTCSGIAMGTGAPEGTYMGAAPGARLVDLRIGTVVGYAPGEVYQDIYDASLQGAQWALEHRDVSWPGSDIRGIDVLSLSWGVDVGYPSPGTDPYSLSLNRLVEAGVHVVAAAGNDGPSNNGFHGMGAADLVITVGATDDDDTVDRTDDLIAEYSSRGPRTDDGDDYTADELKPDVSASGTHIIQCRYSSNPLNDASGNGYGNRGSGTSYAAPSVAGVVALMLEANPDLTPAVSKEILRATAERRGEPTLPDVDPFWNRDFGWGIVDAYRAVKMARELEDVGGIDVELQCFITNHSYENGVNVVKGLTWSRTGARIDRVEVAGWGESSIIDVRKGSAGNMINWSLEIRSDRTGPANLSAVAISGGSRSLESSMPVELVRTGPSAEGIGAAGTSLIIVLILIMALGGGGAFMYVRKKRKASR